ncbi:hypothetical protein HYALB_00001399 [Hymenoscyphus albidus]|uniref:Uncharacterized protein n=1 Tax=Hymenoscyphus albidus TaxID=595503 RepID=A0A9N9PX14_9HELO|nr:hypothetical protein HYALB_00001399 [Hymenoscyphus albidus]
MLLGEARRTLEAAANTLAKRQQANLPEIPTMPCHGLWEIRFRISSILHVGQTRRASTSNSTCFSTTSASPAASFEKTADNITGTRDSYNLPMVP